MTPERGGAEQGGAEQGGARASRRFEQVSRTGDDALTERARGLAGELAAAEAELAAVLAEVERRGIQLNQPPPHFN